MTIWFAGTIGGDRTDIKVNFKSVNQTSDIYLSGLFENTRIASFKAFLGTESAAKTFFNKLPPVPVSKKQESWEITDDASLTRYLDGKSFKSYSGTQVKIGYSSEYSTYGITINGKFMYFNLTYIILTKYTAIVKGESLTDNSLLKIIVDTKSNSLVNAGTVYNLQ
jgi:hypothetical protein